MAALLVLVFHAARIAGTDPLFPKAWLAVDFFFALSGYVMARTYEARLQTSLRPLVFVKKRFWRFWPVMFCGGVIAAPLLLVQFGPAVAIPVIILNLMLIPYFKGNDIFPINGPYWSLFYELFANAFHAVILARVGNRALGVVIILSLGMVTYLGALQSSISLGTAPSTFLGGFFRVLLSYSIGIILFRLWQDEPPISVRFPSLLLVLPLYFIGRESVVGWPLELVFVLVGVPLIIAGGLVSTVKFRLLGDISFPLYALHFPILVYGHIFGLSQFMSCVIAVIAAIVYLKVERIALGILDAKSSA